MLVKLAILALRVHTHPSAFRGLDHAGTTTTKTCDAAADQECQEDQRICEGSGNNMGAMDCLW